MRRPAKVVQAWRRLRATGGRVSVRELAEEAGWSARHLRAMMRRETGVGPEDGGSGGSLRPRPPCGRCLGAAALADVAAATGYAPPDLDRQISRVFAGAPPSRWLAEEVRNVQVPPAEQLAVSTS